ncbi:MAG: SDR family oxidoreductase [SAR202 cluster bacterium]|nr:SDR family oxidoreductase [SAR202 cluster bacterium]
MDLELTGKAAIITGGSEGIGKASAKIMCEEGANVVICARRQELLDSAVNEIKTTAKGEIIGISADVTNPDDIKNVVESCITKFGRIDILVNNAGTSNANNFETVDDDVWQHDLDLKFFAAIRFSRLAIEQMKKVGGGRIINVTNLGAKQPGANSVPTSVSRAAGIALTKAMSKDLAQYNILVNTVLIGLIKSGQHQNRFHNEKGVDIEQYYEERSGNIPLKRFGEAEEAGNIISFLASGKASYITGTSMNIDGGTSGVL